MILLAIYVAVTYHKGKDILFFGNFESITRYFVYHFGITDFDKQSTDKAIMKVFYLNHLKLKSILTQTVNGSVENINYLANLELKLTKNNKKPMKPLLQIFLF